MKIRVRGEGGSRRGGRSRGKIEVGAYDPDVAPDPEEWLARREGDRLDSIVEYHQAAGIKLPSVRAHAALHVVIENQLAEGLAPVVAAYERLLGGGHGRHDAIHALGTVVGDLVFQAVKNSAEPSMDAYFERLARIAPPKGREN